MPTPERAQLTFERARWKSVHNGRSLLPFIRPGALLHNLDGVILPGPSELISEIGSQTVRSATQLDNSNVNRCVCAPEIVEVTITLPPPLIVISCATDSVTE